MSKYCQILSYGLRTAIIGLLFIMAACSETDPRAKNALNGLSARQIFQKAEVALDNKEFDNAAFFYSEVERLFPYSKLTPRAIIMQGYAFHRAQEHDQARASLNRYIQFYPTQEDASYAHYLLALSYYDRIQETGRNQGVTLKALQALRVVIEEFPDTEYARSAILKFDLAFNHLAAKEMEVGRYYLRRGHYSAAVNRFRTVVQDFQTTTLTAEALHRLVESYLALGLTQEAQTAAAILGHNYQSNEWYEETYALLNKNNLTAQASGEGWLNTLYHQMIRGER